MKQRGMTLVELMTAMGAMGFVMFGILALFMSGLRSFQKTSTDTVLSQRNAQGLRRVAETIRQAASISISPDGMVLTYYMPKNMATADPVTGEKELVVPVVSDGVAHQFQVEGGNLTDGDSGRTLVENVMATDPDPNSSQYQQTYMPFQLTTIGSSRAVSINLITSEVLVGNRRYARMKTTALIRNAQ